VSRIEFPRRYLTKTQQSEPDAAGGVSGPELGPRGAHRKDFRKWSPTPSFLLSKAIFA
jgi:hypothetical protein